MHLYLFAVFPVTGLLVAGYVTLYCAKASLGRMQTFSFPSFNGKKTLASWSLSMR